MLGTLHVLKEVFILELIPTPEGPEVTPRGEHVLPQGPTRTQQQRILWGRASTSHGVSFQHLSCPLGNSPGREELQGQRE